MLGPRGLGQVRQVQASHSLSRATPIPSRTPGEQGSKTLIVFSATSCIQEPGGGAPLVTLEGVIHV